MTRWVGLGSGLSLQDPLWSCHVLDTKGLRPELDGDDSNHFLQSPLVF